MSLTVLATARQDIAGYVDALVLVYTILIFAYIITTWIFAAGARMPYNRALDWLLTFLRDVVEPYLRLFRRIIPPLGPLDLSPIVALIVLQVVGRLLVGLIAG